MLPAIACPTAPGADSVPPSLLTQLIAPARAEVGQWLAQAGELGLTDATAQRGVLFLEQLFAALTPKETVLLRKYPNPFNPETWIPYGLANGTNVQIAIYDISGALARQLETWASAGSVLHGPEPRGVLGWPTRYRGGRCKRCIFLRLDRGYFQGNAEDVGR